MHVNRGKDNGFGSLQVTMAVFMQLGREQERGASVAAAVGALVGAAGCGNCLVWSKSDAFVTAYQRGAAAPHLVGYIVAAEADEALARPLRLAAPEVRMLILKSG